MLHGFLQRGDAGVACVTAGTVEVGEPCEFGNDCLPGSLCTNGTCWEVCNNNADADQEDSCQEKCGNIVNFTPAEWGIERAQTRRHPRRVTLGSGLRIPHSSAFRTPNGATCQNSNGDGELGAGCGTTQDCLAGLYCSDGCMHRTVQHRRVSNES